MILWTINKKSISIKMKYFKLCWMSILLCCNHSHIFRIPNLLETNQFKDNNKERGDCCNSLIIVITPDRIYPLDDMVVYQATK